jgi:hypothetical protein
MNIDGHFIVSMVKSGMRIIACAFLMLGDLPMAGGLLMLAESLGIVEEMV